MHVPGDFYYNDQVDDEEPCDEDCPCGCEGNRDKCVYSCLDDTNLATSEEFNHILKVRLHFRFIIERDMTPKMVDLLKPYEDYLIRAVMEAQNLAEKHG